MHTGDMEKKAKQLKSTQWGALRTINWFPWSFQKVTGDSRCASKGIHWFQTSLNCFSNRSRQIYRHSLQCTKKALDQGFVPLSVRVLHTLVVICQFDCIWVSFLII